MSGAISAQRGDIGGFNIDGHSITTTGVEINDSSQATFISSSNFSVDHSGNVTASNVSMSGTVTATAGEIGGFTIDGHSLTSTGIEINNSTQATFISSSNFQVDHSGNVTASNISMSGAISTGEGDIGGFTIGTSSISSTGVSIGNIDEAYFLSSSKFTVDHSGSVTASDISMSGNISAAGGDIGGFTIDGHSLTTTGVEINDATQGLFISSSEFTVDHSGNVTASSVSMSGNISATTGEIGGFTIDGHSLTSTGVEINNSTQALFISSSNFTVDHSGSMTASEGLIAGWDIVEEHQRDGYPAFGWARYLGSRDPNTNAGIALIGYPTGTNGFNSIHNSLRVFTSGSSDLSSSTAVVIGSLNKSDIEGNSGLAEWGIEITNPSSSNTPFLAKYREYDGTFTASIAGWNFDDDKLYSDNLQIKSDGEITTTDFVSGLKGWRISENGTAEFGNAIIRGTLSTTVFEKDTISAVGGQVIVANSTVTTGSADLELASGVTHTQSIEVENAGGFVVDEWLVAKATHSNGFTKENMKIISVDSSSTPHSITVSRSISDANFDNIAFIETMSLGQVLVSQGVSGSGYVLINADPNDSNTPFIDIVERSGNDDAESIDLKARIGDLSGISDNINGTDVNGFGIYTDNAFLKGGVAATFGSIGGFGITSNAISSSNNNLIMKDTGEITGSDVKFTGGQIAGFEFNGNTFSSTGVSISNATQTHFISSSKFTVDHSGNVTASNISMSGNISATTGDIGGFAIDGHSLTSTGVEINNGTQAIFISSSLFTVDHSGNMTASSGKIGGFQINDSEIRTVDIDPIAGEYFLHFKASGEMTASAGKIGGFVMDEHSLSTTGVEINNSTQAIFISSSNFTVDHSGNVTASNVSMSGTVTAESGAIGDWYLSQGRISSEPNYASITNGTSSGVVIQGGASPQIQMGTENVLNYARMYYTNESNYGIEATKLGQTTFQLGSANTIAGFGFDENEIYSLDNPTSVKISKIGQATFISSSNFVVDHSGNVTASQIKATGGTIGDWRIEGSSLFSTNMLSQTGSGILLEGDTNPRIVLREDDNNYVSIQYANGTNWGIKGQQGGNTVFRLGNPNNQGNSIAGFSFDDHSITTTGVELNDSTQALFLSSSNFTVDHSGNVDITGGKITVAYGSEVPGANIANVTWYQSPLGTNIPVSAYENISAIAGAQNRNAIDYRTGPFGGQELVWLGAPNTPVTPAAPYLGGFYTDYVDIDKNYAYMFVCYVKPKETNSAINRYFGFTSNPRFFAGDITPQGENGVDSLDRWFLMVGYVYPSGSGYNADRKSICYDLTTGLTASFDQIDESVFRWRSDIHKARLKAYAFDSVGGPSGGDGSVAYTEWARPGIYKMDGSEPTIQSLLSNVSQGGNTVIDGGAITTGRIKSSNWNGSTSGSLIDLN